MIDAEIINALGKYIYLRIADRDLIVSSGNGSQWTVGHRYQDDSLAYIPLVELALDVSKLDLLEKIEWNQLHVTTYSAPVVFSDERGGVYAEMIYLVMPAQIRDRQYLDVALANAI
jgi:hypothetical protein